MNITSYYGWVGLLCELGCDACGCQECADSIKQHITYAHKILNRHECVRIDVKYNVWLMHFELLKFALDQSI